MKFFLLILFFSQLSFANCQDFIALNIDEMLSQFKQEEPKASQMLYHVALRYARKHVSNFHDAEDVAAKSMYVLYKKDIPQNVAASSWVYGVVRKKAIDYYRHQNAEKRKVELNVPLPPHLEGALDLLESDFADGFDRLNPDQQKLIILRLQGHTFAEMGEMYGMHESYLRRKYHQAEEKLRLIFRVK